MHIARVLRSINPALINCPPSSWCERPRDPEIEKAQSTSLRILGSYNPSGPIACNVHSLFDDAHVRWWYRGWFFVGGGLIPLSDWIFPPVRPPAYVLRTFFTPRQKRYKSLKAILSSEWSWLLEPRNPAVCDYTAHWNKSLLLRTQARKRGLFRTPFRVAI